MSDMYVTKRNGQKEILAFDKIVNRIRKIGQEVDIQLNYSSLTMKVIDQLYDGIPTTKIDELTCEQCASLSSQHPDYGTLAARIFVSNHQKNTSASFYNVMKQLYWFYDTNKVHSPLISLDLWNIVVKYREEIQAMIDYQRDYLFEYFGLKTLERAYLFHINGTIIERPQHMWMRVAIGIHGSNIVAVKETYDLMSKKYFTHATPTLFNAGTPRPQLSSCYLIALEEDSLDGIYDTLKDCARISKWSGGIGLHIHNVRAKDTLIRGTNGKSSGIVPMLRVFNDTARFINQGGKRNGSFAIYLETWHPDIEDFLEMKKNHGDEEMRARDLFYALWVSDLFMERVKTNAMWSYFCPNECTGLSDVYGQAFVELYTRYESDGKARKTVNARDLWFKILDAQMETGTPYILYKDAANEKSNQKNIGTIKSSNLCVAPETKILTDKGHIEIRLMEGQNVNVWNGEEFSNVTIMKTGENQELMEVETSDGSTLTCTPYHKFYIQQEDTSQRLGQIIRQRTVDAQYLQVGDTLISWTLPYTDKIVKGITIRKTRRIDRRDDTYCFNEPKRHAGIFNGILTSQCTEIIEYSDEKETAVCNLASVALPAFVLPDKTFDYDKLQEVVQVMTTNLNRIIDINYYPTEKTRRSNFRHRPIGIGVQGLADTFILMDIAFCGEEAITINKRIFETIYFAALTRSCNMAKERYEQLSSVPSSVDTLWNEYERESFSLSDKYAGAYSTFKGSPASQGLLQFDLWTTFQKSGAKDQQHFIKVEDWDQLKADIQEYGIRNSLLVAPMPTASTSQILGYNECFEPLTSNIYSRRTLAGEFLLANKYLMKELIDLGLWDEKIKNNIIANKGSIQQLTMIPEKIREKYKIVWEMPMKHLIDMSADRGAFICQSQSLNLWLEDPNYNTLTSMHFYAWKKGLKTGIYYLRRKGKHQAQQFTVEPEPEQEREKEKEKDTEPDICEMCSA
jgi:ribonucleotide reductase alpha subunit